MNDKLQKLKIANKWTTYILEDLKAFILREKVVSTEEVDNRASRIMKMMDVVPAFKGYKGFPGNLCISINDEVVHGIPSKDRLIQKGDLVSLDLGIIYQGYYSDMAISFVNRKFSFGKKQKLVEDTKQALDDAIKALKQAFPKCHLSHITAAIDPYKDKYGIVYTYGGHGIGQTLHEGKLFVSNSWNNFSRDQILQVGTVFTIEPMFTLGSDIVKIAEDGYTIKTVDGSLAAHFEYSVAMTEKGIVVLK
jgi:methionyl aminopeptidase